MKTTDWRTHPNNQLQRWLEGDPRRAPVSTFVLHSTVGRSAVSSLLHLQSVRLSYHYVIERDGSVIKSVPAGLAARHCGRSEGPDGRGVNAYSVGAAFACMDRLGDEVTLAQVDAVIDLIAVVRKQFKDLRWLTRHRDISPGRKVDPATLVRSDLERIASETGLKVWP